MSLQFFQHVTTAEIIVTFCASLAFIALYTLIARWWRSALGRNLVAFDAALSLTLLPSVVHHTLGTSSAESQFFAWFTVVAFGLVPVVIAWRAVIMVRAQFEGAHVRLRFRHCPQPSGPIREPRMSNHPRRYGRRAPKNAPALMLAHFLTGVVPPHPVAADYLARLGGWQMLGNDRAGDCVAVTWANLRRLITAVLGAESYPSQDWVWQVYKTQNPGFDPNGSADTNGPGSDHDQGMDIQTLLEYLVKTGGPDGVKAVGFAKVDVKNLEELRAAVAIFGSVWLGIDVLDANQQEFADGRPWDYVRGSALDGGHSVLGGGYGAPGAGQLGGDMRIITWAEETSLTDAFMAHEAREAWAVVWPEHLGLKEFLAGMNLTGFAAAWSQITGRVFPVAIPPAPAPAPVPTPTPAPTPVPSGPSGAEVATRARELFHQMGV